MGGLLWVGCSLDSFYLVLVEHNLFIPSLNPYRVDIEDAARRRIYPVVIHHLTGLSGVWLYAAVPWGGGLAFDRLDFDLLPDLIYGMWGRHGSTLIKFRANHNTKLAACQPPK